jgi:hypothetical protein
MYLAMYAQTPTDVRTTDRTIRRDRKRQQAIDNVMERLDVYSVLLVAQEFTALELADKAKAGRYAAMRKQQAAAIVDAVLGLTRE